MDVNPIIKLQIVNQEIEQIKAELYSFSLKVRVQKALENQSRVDEFEKVMEGLMKALDELEKELEAVKIEAEKEGRKKEE